MSKEILFSEDIRRGMIEGIDKVADAVRVTLGPKGRNVIMYQKANLRDSDYSDKAGKGAHALVTNDGVTIARSVILQNPAENLSLIHI